MAMITLENHSKADIYIPLLEKGEADDKGKTSVIFNQDILTIPRTKREEIETKGTGEKTFRTVIGKKELTEQQWELVKGKKAVTALLESQKLKVVGSGPPPSTKPQGK